MFNHTTKTLALAALIPAPALAQDTLTQDMAQPLVLDGIVLSAGLSPVADTAYGRAHSVLTAQDMAERGHVTVQDALRDLPGLWLTSSGETLTALRIRGSEANHVLVLIDGVEANAPSSGAYTFSGMLTADIDRIEVLRGPQSAIYGANAAAGVVAITTRQADAPGLRYGGGVELGGQNTRAANAWVRASGARAALALSLATRHSDGEDGARVPGGDTEFNDRETLGLTGSYDLTETVRAGFSLRHTWQEYGYDANAWSPVAQPEDYVTDAPLTADRDETYGALWLEAEALDGAFLSRLALSGNNQDSDYYNDGLPDYDDASRLRSLRYSGSWALDGTDARDADQKLSFAFEKKREIYRASYAAGGEFRRDTRSVALEYQGRFANGIGVQAGLRHDMNEVIRDATSWGLAAAWQLPGRDLRLRAAIGKSTVNPDMFQMFGYIPGSYRGNPDLSPETSLGYEIGADLDFAAGRGSLGATLFVSKVDDLITGTGSTSDNLDGTSTRKGVELSLDYAVTDWLRLGANYTYTHARTAEGTRIPRQPRHALGLRASAEFAEGRGMVSADLRQSVGNYDMAFFSTPWDQTPPTTRLPDYVTVDLAAHYDLSDDLRLTGRVVNLFDEDYSESWGYYGQGRTAYAGITAAW